MLMIAQSKVQSMIKPKNGPKVITCIFPFSPPAPGWIGRGEGANAWLIKPIWQWRLSGKFDWHHINVSSASQSQGDYLLKFEIFLPYLFSHLAAYKSCIETNLEDCSDDQKREFDYNYNINEEGYLNELKRINDVQTRCAETPCDPNPCQNGGACTSQVSTSLLYW